MIAGSVIAVDDIAGSFAQLGLLIMTTLAGLGALLIVILSVFAIACRSNPFKVIPFLFPAWLITFATTSA